MTQLNLRWTEVIVCGGALCGVVVLVAGAGVSRQVGGGVGLMGERTKAASGCGRVWRMGVMKRAPERLNKARVRKRHKKPEKKGKKQDEK
jgi:hypothetical protein